jgi:dTDP-4-dehydrorhamnose 3,5-epimerase
MAFSFEKTIISDIVVIEPEVFTDDRGFFIELYKMSVFREFGINGYFVQDNHSLSSRGCFAVFTISFPREPRQNLCTC